MAPKAMQPMPWGNGRRFMPKPPVWSRVSHRGQSTRRRVRPLTASGIIPRRLGWQWVLRWSGQPYADKTLVVCERTLKMTHHRLRGCRVHKNILHPYRYGRRLQVWDKNPLMPRGGATPTLPFLGLTMPARSVPATWHNTRAHLESSFRLLAQQKSTKVPHLLTLSVRLSP